MTTKPTVLIVTTTRWFSTARLAMALARAGCNVEALCPSGHPLVKTSAVQRTYAYRGLTPLTSLKHALSASKPDLILPGDDLSTQHLHALYDCERLKGHEGESVCALITRSLGAPDGFPVVCARACFIEAALQEGILVPETAVIQNAEDMARWLARSGFPTVLKANGTTGGVGVRVVHSVEEANQAFRALQAPPLLARAVKRALVDSDRTLLLPSLLRRRNVVNGQRFVPGREATSLVACWEGKILASLQFEVLKKRGPSAPATVVRIIENAQMSRAAERIADRLKLSGLHGFDFMLESHTQKACLIEINPRATQVGHLTLGPDHDLPAALYAAISGEPLRPAPKITEHETITLFPHEWISDPASSYLASSYHDVPWEEPELVRACVRKKSFDNIQHHWQSAHSKASVFPTTAPVATVSKPLSVLKFGGTSVGNADCIANVVEIIRAASREGSVVVVVSAMCGVTNSLIEAAAQSEAGNLKAIAAIFDELRIRHNDVVESLITSPSERARITRKLQSVLAEGERLCKHAVLSGKLSTVARDSISALGERLCAPLLAAALTESHVTSEAMEATELIVTDAQHGNADPIMCQTRERCAARLLPLLRQGTIPVVTGFIGATAEGALTTLGRGGSDYSATILGAVLDANEVVIWTDVDGMLTADPRLVAEARTIAEISYHEASALASFGAKVLHPKTLRPVMQSDIPLWIRNSFAPEQPGTKITPAGSGDRGEVRAVSAIGGAAVITLHGPALVHAHDVIGRALAAAASVRAEVLLTFSTPSEISLAVMSPLAKRAVAALQQEFARELAGAVEPIKVDPTVAIVTTVGRNILEISGTVERVFSALLRERINLIAFAEGPSEHHISFVIAQKDLNAALRTTHQEFRLGHTEFAASSNQRRFAEGAA